MVEMASKADGCRTVGELTHRRAALPLACLLSHARMVEMVGGGDTPAQPEVQANVLGVRTNNPPTSGVTYRAVEQMADSVHAAYLLNHPPCWRYSMNTTGHVWVVRISGYKGNRVVVTEHPMACKMCGKTPSESANERGGHCRYSTN